MEIRSFWVDVENAAGQRVGKGPIRALNFRISSLLSACGEFEFDISAADPNLPALREKRIVICRYVDRDGLLHKFGGGVIDKIVTTGLPDGSMGYHVSGNDLGRELTYRSVGQLDLSGVAGAGVTNAPTLIMALAPSGWSVTSGTTLSSIYAGFDGESVLYALSKAGEQIGEHWRLGEGRVVEWLGPANVFEASGVRAVQHVNDPVATETADDIAVIASLEEESDAADLITRVIPRGSGNGDVALTLAALTAAAPAGYTVDVPNNYVKRNDAENDYGRIERSLEFKDIGPLSNTKADLQAAANTLMRASVEHLRRYGAPQKFYRVEFTRVGHLLQPGTTMRVVYRKLIDDVVVYDLDAVFNILKVEAEISAEGISTVAVTVSTIDRQPQTDSEYLASQAINARVLSAHQQLGPSVDTMTWRDELDSSHGATLSFWLGDEYTSIQRAVVRFRIQPLRSTVKSVAGRSTTTQSGGAVSQTSGSGGGSNQTSSSGGGGTASGGSHLHNTSILSATPNAPDVGWYASGSLIGPASAGSSAGKNFQVGVSTSHTHDLPDHTHDVDIPNHTHNMEIPDHTHEVSPEIDMEYGLFEESAGNTLGLGDLSIRLNYGAELLPQVRSISGGWYEVDITNELVDEVFRPRNENNAIGITTSTASKTARIEAQLTIRGVVQAVNYD